MGKAKPAFTWVVKEEPFVLRTDMGVFDEEWKAWNHLERYHGVGREKLPPTGKWGVVRVKIIEE